MLILTRRTRQSFFIGDDIEIIVLGVRGSSVRIGIIAPQNVPIHREEIYERIKRELAACAVDEEEGQPSETL